VRTATFLAAALMVGEAWAMPPYVNELVLPVARTAAAVPANGIPKVARGQYLGLSCTNIEQMASDSILVVLYLAMNEPPAGMKGVLATDQTITPGTIHVRVPDMAELVGHTVYVRVYYLESGNQRTCDAGNIRII
jgi:hypothetical protein